MKPSAFFYRLFFTRDDDLDVLQLLFVFRIVSDTILVLNVAANGWALPAPAWWFLGLSFLTLAIAGTPKWVAGLIANSKALSSAAGAFPGERQFGVSTAIWEEPPADEAPSRDPVG